MSEQDDADVIEREPRQFSFPAVPGLPALRGIIGTGSRRLAVIAAACALVVTAATLDTFLQASGGGEVPTAAIDENNGYGTVSNGGEFHGARRTPELYFRTFEVAAKPL